MKVCNIETLMIVDQWSLVFSLDLVFEASSFCFLLNFLRFMPDHWKKKVERKRQVSQKIEFNEFLDREISGKTMQARNHYPQNKTNCSRNFVKIPMAASGFNKNVN